MNVSTPLVILSTPLVIVSEAKDLVRRTYQFFVYIMANEWRTIYVGVTNNLDRRVFEHKQKIVPGFTRRYGLGRLVYFEEHGDVRAAIEREKQIKGWKRFKKVALIDSQNPEWKDLAAEWSKDPSLRSG